MRPERAAGIATAAALLVLLVLLLAFTDPWTRDTSHAIRTGLAAFAVVAVGVRLVVGASGVPWLRGALLVAVVAGSMNYYRRSAEVFWGIDDFSDITYYYLNAKYLDELGHYDFYPALILADLETNDHHASRIERVRDLRDDELKSASFALLKGAEVKKRFSADRWAAFAHDADVLLARQTLPELRYIYIDHGYNPPATWSVVGGAFASAVPIAWLKLLTFLDLGLVVVAFGAVGWVFGIEPLLWALLFFVTTFSGRWPVLGQALLRFDWLCALLAAMCALRRDRYALAGGLLGYAAASRVFPAIFFGAWLFEAVADTWQARRVPARHVRFAAAAVGVVVTLSGLAIARYGVEVCLESVSSLALHSRSFSSHRIGAGVIATWRGEFDREALRLAGGMAAREQVVRSLRPVFVAVAAGLVGVLGLVALRTRRPAWEMLPWMILPLFAVTNPQVNYWNLRVVAVIWHAVWLVAPPRPLAPGDRVVHALGIGILFAAELVSFLVFHGGYERHAVHAMASWGLALWGALILGWMALGCGAGDRLAGIARSPRGGASAAG